MLIKKDDRIIRVLETKGDHKLIINCSQKSMPTWIAEEDLSGYALAWPIAEPEALSLEDHEKQRRIFRLSF